MICCQLEDKNECFASLANEVNLTWVETHYLDATNDGGQAVVEFNRIWQRRVLEVQVQD